MTKKIDELIVLPVPGGINNTRIALTEMLKQDPTRIKIDDQENKELVSYASGLFKTYLKEHGVVEPQPKIDKENSEQDFAEKMATELNDFIMEYGDLHALSIGDEIKNRLLIAIKQAIEIGRLEAKK